MSLKNDLEIKMDEVREVYVQRQNDRLSGTPDENKKVFDVYPDLIRSRFNEALDALDVAIDNATERIETLEDINVEDAATIARASAEFASASATQAQSALAEATSYAVKHFKQKFVTTDEEFEVFTFNPQGYAYSDNDYFEIFINGFKLNDDEYSHNSVQITLAEPIDEAGNVIEVCVTKFVDAITYAEQAQAFAQNAEASSATAQGYAEEADSSFNNINNIMESVRAVAQDANQSATASANSASESFHYSDIAQSAEENASNYAEDARANKESASQSASQAQSSASSADTSATQASGYAQDSSDSAEDSEAWAVGQRGGVDVPSTDPAYENNSKYWAELNAGDHAELIDIRVGADGTTYARAGDAVRGQVSDLKTDLDDLNETVNGTEQEIEPQYSLTSGKYINTSGLISNSSKYSLSSEIELKNGDVLSFSTLVRTACPLAKSLGGNLYQVLINEPTNPDTPKDYSYTATEDMYVVISERGDTLSNVVILRNLGDGLKDKVDVISDYVGGYETVEPEYTKTDGYVIDSSGNLITEASYEMTSAFRVKAGDTLSFKTLCKTRTVLAEKIGESSYRYLIREMTNPSLPIEYTYHVGSDMDVVICGKIGTINNVIIERFSDSGLLPDMAEVKEALPNGGRLNRKSLNGNMSVKAFREFRFDDGTSPLYKDVLWYDDNGGFYLSDNANSPKKKLFNWSDILSDGVNSAMYSAFIVSDGSVLFVYGTQFQSNAGSATPSDNYRKNPILYKLVDGEYVGEVIDFENNLKPTNWLQNVGIIESARHDCIIFCEYTRALEATARVWKVSFPITDPSNWEVVLSYSVAHPYGELGFKHFHTVQEDPFYDVIYVTSGDDSISSGCWASADGGDTFAQIEPFDNAKWRMLNMVFRPDHVYWASDDWTTRHKFWKATRNAETNIIDYSTITEVFTFPDNSGSNYVATYASVYLECFNAIVFLDRNDSDNDISYIAIYVYDLNDEELYDACHIGVADNAYQKFIGFRNEAVLLFPRDNKILVGFSGYYLNYNKLLGNIGSRKFNEQINNLVLTVGKTADGYSIAFDTIY